MSTLHGSWIENHSFFIWGEVWRTVDTETLSSSPDQISEHPFNLTTPELLSFLQLQSFDVQKLGSEKIVNVTLPSYKPSRKKYTLPLLSSQLGEEAFSKTVFVLQSWQVVGRLLNPSETVDFLAQVPLGEISYLGDDLRYWSHVYRWILDLLARGKYLPGGLTQTEENLSSSWYPLLDSTVDQARLAKLTSRMPSSCLAYSLEQSQDAQEILLSFLRNILDAKIHQSIEISSQLPKNLEVLPWLQSLTQNSSQIQVSENYLKRLNHALDNWSLPIQDYLVSPDNQQLGQNQFRVCFVLEPPAPEIINYGDANWTLNYYLQALDHADFLLDSNLIWQHNSDTFNFNGREVNLPQETLLKGLGLASRLYEPIAKSLLESQPTKCEVDPIQVYQFIKSIAWQLQDKGLGVSLPQGLALGNSEQRLGIKIEAEVTPKKGERLSLKSLLNYNLKVMAGDEVISRQDLEKLLQQRSPIVKVDDQWLMLQPTDVKAAQEILNQTYETINLSVEDALRMSMGDSNVIAKLPVVDFEASGVLKNLINSLMDNQSIEPIEKPAGFKGELRPYQARGVGWLAFLEKWGLGACLADDMGLGKCVANDTLILINGTLQKAEEIWQTYADNEIVFDGEGFWSKPKETLLVNSINEKTGKIVQSLVKSLYRQWVHEKLKKITLQDGSVITITQQHKLLTHQGWKNNLSEEDYICVPSKQIWRGQLQDFDLIKMIAWQIAEGYESEENGQFAISQKNVWLLEDLLETYNFLAKKYNFKANTPQIKIEQEKTPALKICSITYRHFLEEKGYIWGKRSADKSIPEFIMQADLESVKVFLSHYFDAEGSVIPQMRSVEISTASPVIIQQLASLLRRFGIWLRISAKQKCATNGSRIYKTYYIGTFGGNSARRFLQEIGFNDRVKQLKLEKICLEKNNTNVEGIPASKIVAEAVRQAQLPIRHFGMNNTVYINGSQQFTQTSLAQVIKSIDYIITGIAEQEYRQLKSSKWTSKTLEAYCKIDRLYLQNTKNDLENLLNQEVFYCAIKTIEEIDYTGWVYDLEVSEHHNFVANNILCHNTIQTIAFLLNLKQDEMLAKPTLLVCPTSVVNNWEREVHKFAPTLSTIIHQGNQRKKGKAFVREIQDKTLVITSYPLVYRDAETLAQVEWQGIVLDEAQNIKNPQAKQAQAVRNIKADFKIALTGTPVENRLAELWSILDFLNPGFLGNQSFFQRRFAIPIEKYGDRESLKTLRSLVRPFILRRLKSDQEIIQDLPEKQEMNVFCGLSEEQANLYQTLVDRSLLEIEEKSGIQRRGLILSLLVKLKQICNHPSHFLKEAHVNSAQRSGKLLRLVEMLEELLTEGDRALIFTQFSEWGKLMQAYLSHTLGREVLFLYGQIPQKQRQEMIDRFQNDPNGPPLFILSLKAGGTGLNLTRANHVFHIDRWWNPAVENQATDRAFRIGQKRNVQVHKFVCTGTLEEKINDMIESKKQLAEQTVDAGENWLTELDTDQLRNLLLLDRNAVIDE